MNNIEIIDEFDSAVIECIKAENLIATSEAIKKSEKFLTLKAIDSRNDFNVISDIDKTQSDLIYCTGILYLLRPYINNPTKEIERFNDRIISTYFQTTSDSLYLMYSSICYEKLYNFWDRIGDKLATLFPHKFKKERNIMFANVIDTLKDIDTDDENILWFIDYREKEFKKFNSIRKDIVHYEQLETKFIENTNANYFDQEEIKKIWEEKYNQPDFLKKQIMKTNQAVEKITELLE